MESKVAAEWQGGAALDRDGSACQFGVSPTSNSA